MISNVKNLFSKQENDIALIGRALSHPARVQILKLLMVKSPQHCGEIVEQIPLSQSTVSQHLAELKHAGLVVDKKAQNKMLYSADKSKISMALHNLTVVLSGPAKSAKQSTLF